MILLCLRKKRSSSYQFKIQITDIKHNNKLIFGFDLKQQAEEWLFALESHLIYARDHNDNIYSHLSSPCIMPSYNNYNRPKLTTLLSKYINSVVLYSRLKNNNYHDNHKYNRDQYDVGYDNVSSDTSMVIDTDMNTQVLSHNTDNHQSNYNVDDDNSLFQLKSSDVLIQNYGIINKLLYIIEYCIIMIIMMIVVYTLYYCSNYLSSLQQCCMMIIMVSSIYYLVRKIILTHMASTGTININSNISNNERNNNQCNHNCDSFVSIVNGKDTNHDDVDDDDDDDVDKTLFGPYHRNHQYHIQNNNNYRNNHSYNSNSVNNYYVSSFPYHNKSIDNYIFEINITDSTSSSSSISNKTTDIISKDNSYSITTSSSSNSSSSSSSSSSNSIATEKQTIRPMIKIGSKGGHRLPSSIIRSLLPSSSSSSSPSSSHPEAFESIEEQQLIDPIHTELKKVANNSIFKTNPFERSIKDSSKDSSLDSFDITQVDKWPNYPILVKRSERMMPKRTAAFIDNSTSNDGINEYHHHNHHQPNAQSQQSQQPPQLSCQQQQLIHIHKEGDLHQSIFDLESDYFVGIGFIVVAGMTSTPAHLFK